MFAEIERAHGVTGEQILEARFYRDWRFDFMVLLSFVVFYVVGSFGMSLLLARSIGHHGSRFWVLAVGVSAIAVALLGIELLGVWATVAEMIRVGNDHLGASRAAKSPWFNPWGRHFGKLLVAGSLVFSTIAWRCGRAWRDKAPTARGPQVITLH
jgi:phosphatidylglycerophosphate synthase